MVCWCARLGVDINDAVCLIQFCFSTFKTAFLSNSIRWYSQKTLSWPHCTVLMRFFHILKCTKFKIFRGCIPEPAGGTYSAPPVSLAGEEGAHWVDPSRRTPPAALWVSHSALSHFIPWHRLHQQPRAMFGTHSAVTYMMVMMLGFAYGWSAKLNATCSRTNFTWWWFLQFSSTTAVEPPWNTAFYDADTCQFFKPVFCQYTFGASQRKEKENR